MNYIGAWAYIERESLYGWHYCYYIIFINVFRVRNREIVPRMKTPHNLHRRLLAIFQQVEPCLNEENAREATIFNCSIFCIMGRYLTTHTRYR